MNNCVCDPITLRSVVHRQNWRLRTSLTQQMSGFDSWQRQNFTSHSIRQEFRVSYPLISMRRKDVWILALITCLSTVKLFLSSNSNCHQCRMLYYRAPEKGTLYPPQLFCYMNVISVQSSPTNIITSPIIKIFKTLLRSCFYRGADKSLARPTSQCILFDGENISFYDSLVIYIYTYIYITNIPPIMIINRICETQNLLSL